MIDRDRFVALRRVNVQRVRVAVLLRESWRAGAAVRVRQRIGDLASGSVLLAQANAAETGDEVAKSEIAARQNDFVVVRTPNEAGLLKLFQMTGVAIDDDLCE